MVEFAISLPVFLLLLFGVVELARLTQSWVPIHHAVEEAGRHTTTGDRFSMGAGVRETEIANEARRAAFGLLISEAAAADAPQHFAVVIRRSRLGPDPMGASNAGGANDFVRLEVCYNHPLATSILGNALTYIPLQATVMVLNERFARPTGVTGELPPTPVATWTQTATPGPRPTPTITPTVTSTRPSRTSLASLVARGYNVTG